MRSEEEKSRDIYIHEKRAAANDIIEEYRKKRSRAIFAACIGGVVLFCVGISFIMAAYDSQNIPLLLLLVGALIIMIAAVYCVAGSMLFASPARFFSAVRLIRRWQNMLEEVDEAEQKQLEGTLRPMAMEKTEERLLLLCDKIIDSSK